VQKQKYSSAEGSISGNKSTIFSASIRSKIRSAVVQEAGKSKKEEEKLVPIYFLFYSITDQSIT
jgi:hypothetical protein